MTYILRIICTSFLLGTVLLCVNAQESVNTSGGKATGNGGTANYTVGQIIYTTNSESSGSVAQGVQQAYEISVENSIDILDAIRLNATAYPNPTNDMLTLKIGNANLQNMNYQLYDLHGKQLFSGTIVEDLTNIYMGKLIPSSYFLKVFDEKKDIKTFKIIKK